MREEERVRLERVLLTLASLPVPQLSLGRSVGRRVEEVADAVQHRKVHERDKLSDHDEDRVQYNKDSIVLVGVAVDRKVRLAGWGRLSGLCGRE